MNKRRRISLGTKLNVLIVCIILAVSAVLMITSYSAYCRKVDEFCYGRCEEAAVTASKSGSSLIEDIRNAIDTDAFRQVREQAIAKNEEEIIREWMRSKPRADRPDHSLYEEYEELVQTYDDARRLFKQADIYIQYMVNGAVYMLVDPEGNLFSIGSKGDILPEFAGYKDNESVPPTVYRSKYGWLCTACEPIRNPMTEKVVGMACVDLDMNDVMKERRWFLMNCAVVVLIDMAAAIAISMFLMKHFVTRPLNLLAGAAREFGSIRDVYTKDNVMQLPIRSNDEMGDLYHEFRSMQKHIVENTEKLTSITAQKERTDTELRMAASLQKSMLPSDFPAFPERSEFDLFARMSPAKEIGGDFYDFFFVDDDHLYLAMADVSGKGMPAALFMALCKVILAEQAKTGKSPVRILKDANIEICAHNRGQMFVTVWLGILEISTGTLCFADAGHENPLLRRDGRWELLSKELSGIPLGVFTSSPDGSELFPEQMLTLHHGDVLVQYTDGVTEATHENQRFGKTGLLSSVNHAPSAKPEQLLDYIRQQIDTFVGQEPQFDDITMMALQYN
ncbi:MAG: SpoIIE family protein phosphatase [Oscillospiraceae bacterium]|nr:SpoIIE family protein phosphatase [Oscillospiraceae bacterium]